MQGAEVALLETLTEPQQLQVYELMAITDIHDGNIAAQLYIDANYDLNRAIQNFFDGGSRERARVTPMAETTTRNNNNHRAIDINPQPRRANFSENELRVQYRKHLERKEREEEEKGAGESFKYGAGLVMRGLRRMYNTIMPIAIRGETEGGEQFLVYFRERYPDLVGQLNFNSGTFDDNVWTAKHVIRPMLAYMHIDGPVFKEIPNKIFRNRDLIQFMNNTFQVLGVLVNTKSSEKILKYIETKNCPCLAVFRTNLFDETVLVEFIPLTNQSTSAQVLDRLKAIDRSYHSIRTEEERIKRDVARALINSRREMAMPWGMGMGDFEDQGGFQPPNNNNANQGQGQTRSRQVNPEEQERIEQDRMLRQIQDEEFKEVERKILEQQEKKAQEERLKKEMEEKEHLERSQREEEEKKVAHNKEMFRQQKLQSLPQEPAENDPEAIVIIFRLPDGNRAERRFRISDKSQALYDYVDSKEVVFDSTTVRYDLMQPRPFLCLGDKEKSVGEYFEGSNHEVIHVRELTE